MVYLDQFEEFVSRLPLKDAAYRLLLEDRQEAHADLTFYLRTTHPEASETDLKSAILNAMKFHSDCMKNFAYRSPHYFEDCKRAVELAKAENLGFLDETYKCAEGELMHAMR